MVLSETKSALVIKKFLNVIAYLQSEILIFLVFVSSGDLTFFSGDITNFGQHDSGFGRHDFGRDDSRATWPVTFKYSQLFTHNAPSRKA